MPSQSHAPRVPSYRRHKPSGQAVVSLGGKDFYLGKWNTKASRREYDRLIGEWLAAGRSLPPSEIGSADEFTVAELCVRYFRWAKGYYQKDGSPTQSMHRVRAALRVLRVSYADQPVSRFGPLSLQAIQKQLAASGKSRRYCNYLIQQIRRIFKWGVSQELIPETVYRALTTVPGLKRGRTEATEPAPVRPVPDTVVDATLPHLPAVIADMVRFERLTGCRPAEVCSIRPCDVDTEGNVWLYRPATHKTEHHGRQRIIAIGPKAQDVLRPYLLRAADHCCFVPAESERKRLRSRHAERRTPLSYGNRPGSNRRRRPKTAPGDRYTTGTYRQAIRRTIERVNRGKEDGDQTLPEWTPNQLRHSAATAVRRQFGLEAAQVVLGHSAADVTQVYAERDLNLATEVMRKIG